MEGSPVENIQANVLEAQVIETLRTVYDPEIPINIYELGLVYSIDANAAGKVHVKMTLTSPACPVAGALVQEVESKVRAIEDVTETHVELVWDPPWSPEQLSEAARLQLNL